MSYPGLPAPWLMRQDNRVIDTILDIHQEYTDG